MSLQIMNDTHQMSLQIESFKYELASFELRKLSSLKFSISKIRSYQSHPYGNELTKLRLSNISLQVQNNTITLRQFE